MHDAAINSCPIIQLLYRHQGFAERKNTAVATYIHSDSSMGTKSFLLLLLLVGTCISTAFSSLQKEDCRPLASAIHGLGIIFFTEVNMARNCNGFTILYTSLANKHHPNQICIYMCAGFKDI